ncbi:unnamed protein product [Bursaphelenchus okinawaensis]|uniref:Mos1 transposase HTH domain-containing protein n=1 Tax=Bursaphelenchus okinawaensis TaxID=465554 RepID=A0A811KYU8_9BILA|nr:unnamed protein product [Bursaphelenchus okinawaensis]CAG9113182.1 unnamed protein product [Bursaphelenchus okinawaensis]
MLDKTQLRAIFLYEFKMQSSVIDVVKNVNAAFGEGTATLRTVHRWFRRFLSGDESMKSQIINGRAALVDDVILKQLIEEDPYRTAKDIAMVFGVKYTTICLHMKKIGKVKSKNKWVDRTEKDIQDSAKWDNILDILQTVF